VAACETRRRDAPAPSAASNERRPATPSARGNAGSGDREGSPAPAEPSAASDSLDEPTRRFASDQFAPAPLGRVRLVVMGDYGHAGPHEQRTAELVHALHPDFVLTTGDNNYPLGAAETIDANIGQYFSDLIYPYQGAYGSGAPRNKFYPVLGNHDWGTDSAAAYLAYFSLPGNERYYDVVLGDVHFFALDSDEREPDGVSASSLQARWLEQRLAASKSAFKIVAMHHPPYSSGPHGNTNYMQWPYAEWGADLVLAGHDHCYERLNIDGITYIVSGLGGASLYSFAEPVPGSVARFNEQYGATVLEANSEELRSSFFDVDGKLIDTATYRPRTAR
jgi:3',5'-cyclic AMP phosphodiesterase CpdA